MCEEIGERLWKRYPSEEQGISSKLMIAKGQDPRSIWRSAATEVLWLHHLGGAVAGER